MVLRWHETEGLRGRIGREKLEMQLYLTAPTTPPKLSNAFAAAHETRYPVAADPTAHPGALAAVAPRRLGPAQQQQRQNQHRVSRKVRVSSS